jgi:type VI secretion system protein ImpH
MRTATDSVERLQALFAAIAREPWAWDFYQVLRRIDCLCQDSPRIGTADLPRLTRRYGLGRSPRCRLRRPACRLSSATRRVCRRGSRSAFSASSVPTGRCRCTSPSTRYGRACGRPAIRRFARFADLIHHRFLSLFHRAWAQAQPCVSLDRPGRGSLRLPTSARWRASACRHARARCLARFRQAPPRGVYSTGRSAMRKDWRCSSAGFFRVPVEVEQFVGHWMAVPAARSHAPWRRAALPRAQRLVGRRVWDRQHKFRLRLGPAGSGAICPAAARRPGDCPTAGLRAQLRRAGIHLGRAIVLHAAARCRRCSLDGACRLGYTSWLGRRRRCGRRPIWCSTWKPRCSATGVAAAELPFPNS